MATPRPSRLSHRLWRFAVKAATIWLSCQRRAALLPLLLRKAFLPPCAPTALPRGCMHGTDLAQGQAATRIARCRYFTSPRNGRSQGALRGISIMLLLPYYAVRAVDEVGSLQRRAAILGAARRAGSLPTWSFVRSRTTRTASAGRSAGSCGATTTSSIARSRDL